jgi:hypothetical protein
MAERMAGDEQGDHGFAPDQFPFQIMGLRFQDAGNLDVAGAQVLFKLVAAVLDKTQLDLG